MLAAPLVQPIASMLNDPPADHREARIDHVPQEVDAGAEAGELPIRLESEAQPICEEALDRLLPGEQLLTVLVHEHEVIDVAQVPRDLEVVLHELVELVEVDVSEELAGEVADRYTATWRRVLEALVW